MKKFLVIIKYLFFPFLMAHAAGQIDFAAVTGGAKINAMAETGTAFWLATDNGLWKVNKGNKKTVHLTAGNSQLPATRINDVCATADGNVYAATDKGILRYDGYAYMVIDNENSNLPDGKVTAIACDKNGNLWVGTAGHGLVLMRHSNCRFFTDKNSVLTDNNIDSIMTGNDGTVFALLQNQDLVKIAGDKMILLAEPKEQPDAVAQTH